MLASISGLSEVARLLLDAGADVQLRDRLGLTAIDWSKRRGFSEVAELLGAFGKREVISTKATETKQSPSESIPDKMTKPELVGSQAENLRSLPKQEDSKEENERARQDDIARIQALFDQVKVVDKPSVSAEVEDRKESNASVGDTDTVSNPEEQRLRQQILEAEDNRISQGHRGSDPRLPITHAASLQLEHGTPVTQPGSHPCQGNETLLTHAVTSDPGERENSLTPEQEGSSVEAERAANELAWERSRLEAERLADETRQRVEEEVRKKVLRQKQTGMNLERDPVKIHGEQATKETRGEGSVFEIEQSASEPGKRVKEVRRTSPPRAMRIITPDIWPVEPRIATSSKPGEKTPLKRCPKCNAELKGESCENCLNDEFTVIGGPAPPLSVLARPTVWMLMSVTLAGGVLIGYQLNQYLSINEPVSTPVATAPVQQPVRSEPEVIPVARPLVGGELSGAEASIPEPEYPNGAKSEGISGTITVRVRVNNRGRVILARSSTGDWRLRAAAVQAARKATFLPEKLPSDVRFVSGTITYSFKP